MHVGRDEYPTTLEAAYRLLIRTSEENKRRGNRRYGANRRTYAGSSATFAQGDRTSGNRDRQNQQPQPGRNGIIFDNVTCYTCQRRGNYSDQCPNMDTEENNENYQENRDGANAVQTGVQ